MKNYKSLVVAYEGRTTGKLFRKKARYILSGGAARRLEASQMEGKPQRICSIHILLNIAIGRVRRQTTENQSRGIRSTVQYEPS